MVEAHGYSGINLKLVTPPLAKAPMPATHVSRIPTLQCRNGWKADVANDGFGVMAGKASSGPSSQYSLMSIWKWTPSSRLAAAEQAYVEAEFERLNLVIERNRMEKHEYQRELSAAWLRTVDALEILTALRNAEAAQRLQKTAEKPEPA